MSDWTSLSVRENSRDRFNELKEATGDENVKELSSDEFLKSLMDAWEENGESIYPEQPNPDEIASKVASQLDSNSNPNTTAINEAELAEYLADYLVNGSSQVAEELR